VPFWTKRNPDYGSKMKTINCRDDSLIEDRGMWTTMKKKKRCIVIAQGFYEWLKKGNQKIPHFTRRKDGQLMCLAGLWDMVQFEGEWPVSSVRSATVRHFGPSWTAEVALHARERAVPGSQPACHVFPALCTCRRPTDSPLDCSEKLYTYSIITTDSNQQLNFLHDRMPVILDNGSDAIRTWLDPARTEWSKDLQSLLQPYHGALECYPVSKDVGKVGNNSPSFLVPIDSAENKNNIANFFGNQRQAAKSKTEEQAVEKAEHDLDDSTKQDGSVKIQHDVNETRATTNRVEGTEDNAPLPVPANPKSQTAGALIGIKRERNEAEDDSNTAALEPPEKMRKSAPSASPKKKVNASPTKTPAKKQGTRSATSNGSAAKASKGDGSQKITSFFSNK
jgi:putative SOS response-associated peptidase YedK